MATWIQWRGACSFLLVMSLLAPITSCSTGTDPGDTNVETGHAKDTDDRAGQEKQGEGTHDNERGADR